MEEIEFFEGDITQVLRMLGFYYEENGEWGDKYGVDIDNDIFMMHKFCCCEKEDCPWCDDIGAEPQLIRDIFNIKYSESGRAPNFWYKPLDFKVWWYKYIGRGMEFNKTINKKQIKEMLKKCLAI